MPQGTPQKPEVREDEEEQLFRDHPDTVLPCVFPQRAAVPHLLLSSSKGPCAGAIGEESAPPAPQHRHAPPRCAGGHAGAPSYVIRDMEPLLPGTPREPGIKGASCAAPLSPGVPPCTPQGSAGKRRGPDTDFQGKDTAPAPPGRRCHCRDIPPGRLTRPPEEQVSPREYPSSGAPVPPVPEASSHGTHSPGASHAAAGLRQAFPPAPARNVPGSLTRGLLQSPPEIRGSARCLRAAPGTAPSPHCAHCRTLVWFTGRGRLISMRLRLASGMMRRQSLRERGSAPRGTGGDARRKAFLRTASGHASSRSARETGRGDVRPLCRGTVPRLKNCKVVLIMKNKLTAAVLAASLLASAGAAVAAPAAGGMAGNGSKPAGKCNENPAGWCLTHEP